jgi:hypothetical protein
VANLNDVINLLRQKASPAIGEAMRISQRGAELQSLPIRQLISQYIYNQQQKKLFPQSMMQAAPSLDAPREELIKYASSLAMSGVTGGVKSVGGLYHGTPNKIKGGALAFGKGGVKKGGHSGGLFLTDNPNIAKIFGKNVYKASPNIKESVIDLTKEKNIGLFKNQIGKTYTTFEGEKAIFTEYDFGLMFPKGKADFATVSQYPELVEKVVNSLGKRGIAFAEYAGGKIGKTYQILKGKIPVRRYGR